MIYTTFAIEIISFVIVIILTIGITRKAIFKLKNSKEVNEIKKAREKNAKEYYQQYIKEIDSAISLLKTKKQATIDLKERNEIGREYICKKLMKKGLKVMFNVYINRITIKIR